MVEVPEKAEIFLLLNFLVIIVICEGRHELINELLTYIPCQAFESFDDYFAKLIPVKQTFHIDIYLIKFLTRSLDWIVISNVARISNVLDTILANTTIFALITLCVIHFLLTSLYLILL